VWLLQVGSLAEEEHERGIAHILEHLAFNATQVSGPYQAGLGVEVAEGGR
jgi:predicted Zn-dependent peptidase